MRYALINPPWSFEGSIYFGCRRPHLPLENAYVRPLLERDGHQVTIIDGQLEELSLEEIRRRVIAFHPDFTVITTAPSYLFWRCAPPELRVPQLTVRALNGTGGILVGVGPHCSTTPTAALKKLPADIVFLGECEEILPNLAGEWDGVSSVCYRENEEPRAHGCPHASDMAALPALEWDIGTLHRHRNHHHRFDSEPQRPGGS